MVGLIKTEAVVLGKKSLANEDKIITLFSRELGKINVFAKGIKKITSRRLPHVQTANLINAVIYKKDDRFYLQETLLISGFSKIKNNQKKLSLLYRFFFVLARILPDHEVELLVYKLLLNFLVELSRLELVDEQLLVRYLNSLLKLLGYLKEDKPYSDLRSTIEEIIHEKIPDLHI